MRTVIYQFAPSRSGEHARAFLGQWQGKLVCDDFAGYKASFEGGITEIGCMAHAHLKFFELHDKHKSELAGQALRYIAGLYEIEAQARDAQPEQRLAGGPGLTNNDDASPTARRSRGPSITASSAGLPSCVTLTTQRCRSTTTTSSDRSGRLPWVDPIGCSQAHCAPVNAQRPS